MAYGHHWDLGIITESHLFREKLILFWYHLGCSAALADGSFTMGVCKFSHLGFINQLANCIWFSHCRCFEVRYFR